MHVVIRDLPDIVKQDRYVVGIPQEKMKSWQHYGQLKPLLWFIRYRGLDRPETGNRLFFLRVPIIGKEGFVREYWHRSPRRLNSLSAGLYSEICLWYESRGMSGASEEQLQLYDEAVRRSMLSAVKISEYDGKFKVPEVWLPQDTSLERLEVMEIR